MSTQPSSVSSTKNLRRSSRIAASGSTNFHSANAIHMQAQIDSRLSEHKSNDDAPVANLNELKQGHIFKKSELLDIESDDDEIDEFVYPNPIDDLYTRAANESERFEKNADEESVRKVQEILDGVEDEEMKSLLKTWIFGLASVFRAELTDKPANIAPYKLNLKEINDWNDNNVNRSPPRIILSVSNGKHRFPRPIVQNFRNLFGRYSRLR